MDKNPNQDLQKNCTAEYTTQVIVSGGVQSVILDEAFLLVYSVGGPWYADKKFLQELLVLRIGRGSRFSEVCNLLDDMADYYKVEATLVGGALAASPLALMRKYKSHGYSQLEYPSLIKWR